MSKEPHLYPLKFEPILKQKVWGGTKLKELFGKSAGGEIGESWEISGVRDNVSTVENGPLKGTSLSDLIHRYGEKFLGNTIFKHFGEQFPLLFKFIDAKEDLSIQVHPDDAIAKERHNSFGKTEMWYILQADTDARLILGYKEGVTKEQYLKALENGSVEEVMREVPVKAGDAFYLKPGTVHAIGGGIVLAEIQQTSDITYRIYDWNRPDTDGSLRKLHTQEALDVVSFTPSKEAHLTVSDDLNTPNEICSSPFFHTTLLKLTQPIERDYRSIDSFVVYMCTEGAVVVTTEKGSISMKKGSTVLIPACIHQVLLETKGATILEVYVPSP